MCSSIEVNSANGAFVRIEYSFQAFDFWRKDVTVQSKAMRDSIHSWKQCSKAVSWDHSIAVIVFQNWNNRIDSIDILVSLDNWIDEMKRLGFVWLSVRKSKVNRNMYRKFTATHDVV